MQNIHRNTRERFCFYWLVTQSSLLSCDLAPFCTSFADGVTECFTILLGFNWLFSTEGCCSWEDVLPARSCSTEPMYEERFFPIAWRFDLWRPSSKSQMVQMICTNLFWLGMIWYYFMFCRCALMILNGYDLNIVFSLLCFQHGCLPVPPRFLHPKGLLGHGGRWEVVARLWDRCECSIGA